MSGALAAVIHVRSRRVLIGFLVALNTVPFAPLYPDSGSGESFVATWAKAFMFASLPFWLTVMLLWWLTRRRCPALRCLIAELPGLAQAAVFVQYWQVSVLLLALRFVDGVVLFGLSRGHSGRGCETGTSEPLHPRPVPQRDGGDWLQRGRARSRWLIPNRSCWSVRRRSGTVVRSRRNDALTDRYRLWSA